MSRLFHSKVKKNLLAITTNTKPPLAFDDIICKTTKKKEQLKLLKNTSLSPEQIISIILYSGSKGYTLSHYYYVGNIETKSKKKNVYTYIYKRKDGTIVSNLTDLSEKELNYLLEKQEITNAIIMDKGDRWFCLFQRKRGIMGKEPGEHGSTPHIHFVSNAYNYRREYIVNQIKNGEYPSGTLHIKLTNYL